MINMESFYDLDSREVTFADGSKIVVSGKPLIIDLEELNVSYGLDNFDVELYEVDETSPNKEIKKIKDIDHINKLFHIRTDSSIEEVEVKTGRKGNYYRASES